MKTAPSSTSSSPASIRSAVVFPEPDGPTRTTNSPSSTCRSSASTAGTSVPGYTLVACSKRTSAIGRLRELMCRPKLCLRWRAERIEPEQRGADDRGRRRRPHGELDGHVLEARTHRVDEPAVTRLHEPAAE